MPKQPELIEVPLTRDEVDALLRNLRNRGASSDLDRATRMLQAAQAFDDLRQLRESGRTDVAEAVDFGVFAQEFRDIAALGQVAP